MGVMHESTSKSTGGAPTDPAALGITELLRGIERGERDARDQLFEMVYRELRLIARRQLARRRGPTTLNTTALVHEAYLKLAGDSLLSTRDRGHFFALSSRAMRQVLVDHARRRLRSKRGGGVAVLPLDGIDVPISERAEELVALDGALERLEAMDADLARLVEWRFFGGLSVEEVAGLLDVSDRTVKRHWRAARAFLFRELADQGIHS